MTKSRAETLFSLFSSILLKHSECRAGKILISIYGTGNFNHRIQRFLLCHLHTIMVESKHCARHLHLEQKICFFSYMKQKIAKHYSRTRSGLQQALFHPVTHHHCSSFHCYQKCRMEPSQYCYPKQVDQLDLEFLNSAVAFRKIFL